MPVVIIPIAAAALAILAATKGQDTADRLDDKKQTKGGKRK